MSRLILTAAAVVTVACCEVLAQTNWVVKASATFKEKPSFRLPEAEVLFPLLTNGMPRANVAQLLGEPQQSENLASSPNRWTYSVFYDTRLIVHFKNDRVVKTEAEGF